MSTLPDCFTAPSSALEVPRHAIIRICKKRDSFRCLFPVLALPIFPCSHPQSIVGACELNFCVRDGNRWTLTAINTNSPDGSSPSYIVKNLSASNSFILTLHASSVKHFLLAGDPYRIRTDVKGVRGLCLNHLTNGPWCAFTDSNRGPTD